MQCPKLSISEFLIRNHNCRSASCVYINWTIEMIESISFRHRIHIDVFATHPFQCSLFRKPPAQPWSSSALCKCLITITIYSFLHFVLMLENDNQTLFYFFSLLSLQFIDCNTDCIGICLSRCENRPTCSRMESQWPRHLRLLSPRRFFNWFWRDS